MKVNKHSKKIREIDFQLFPKVAELIYIIQYNIYVQLQSLYVHCMLHVFIK